MSVPTFCLIVLNMSFPFERMPSSFSNYYPIVDEPAVNLLAPPTETIVSETSSEELDSSSSDEETENRPPLPPRMAYGPLPLPNPSRITTGPLAGASAPPPTRYLSNLQNNYQSRLATFPQTWPHGRRDAAEAAKSGFYYTGTNLRIKCAYCGVNVERQNAYTQIVPQHYSLSPRCPALNLTYQLSFDTMIGAVYRSLGIEPEDIPYSSQFSEGAIGAGNGARGGSRPLLDPSVNIRRAIRRVEPQTNGHQPQRREDAFRRPIVSRLWNISERVREQAFGPSQQHPLGTRSRVRAGQQAQREAVAEEEEEPGPEEKPDLDCKVCLSKICCVVFFPCKHLVTCRDCAKQLRICCICREEIKAASAVFF